MSQKREKWKIFCLYVLPYLAAMLIAAAVSLAVRPICAAAADGFLIEASVWENLFTYAPLWAASLIGANLINKTLTRRYVGQEGNASEKKPNVMMYAVAIAVALVVSTCFMGSFSSIKGNRITTNCMWRTSGIAVITSDVSWELTDRDVYVIRLSSGETFRIAKNSDAGKEAEKILFA